MNLIACGIVALTLTVSLDSSALAQEFRRQPPVMEELDRATEQERRGGDREERARRFEAQKRERLLQALQLDDATRARLDQRLGQLEQKAEELRRQRREAFKALREQMKALRKEMRRGPREGGGRSPEDSPSPPPAAGSQTDNSALKQALERVYAVEDAMAGLRRERIQAARELLTPEQQVKFLMFNTRFHKAMRERLQREHGGQDGGPADRRRRSEGDGDGERR